MTSTRHSGRLALTWSNKDKALLAHEDGSYDWVPPRDHRVAEVRLLRDAGTVGEIGTERASDNLLIRGDALTALTSLVQLPEFREAVVGKVRLAYLDPPFNTGQAFAQYDDGLEHSVWLTMMRDRLREIHGLLAPTGSLWVHLDDAEMAYCRLLLDEVFGRDNFIATVVWQKIHSRNNSAAHFSTDHDYLLVFARDSGLWRRNRLPRTARSDADFWNPDDDPRGPWRRSDLTASKPYADGLYEVTGPHGDVFRPRSGRYWAVSRQTFEQLRADGRLWWGKDGRSFPFRKRFEAELDDLVPTTVWWHEEVGNNREAKRESERLFGRESIFATPKPERLLKRVIHIATDPGDLVLDCFAGSGTTAAVAHKMGRRWIIVERSRETIDTFTAPRLKRVVDGDDPGGVTEETGWSGGGGFRILDVAESMYVEDHGMVVLANWATNSALAEAVAAQLGFELEPEGPFCGRRGTMRLAVIDGHADELVVETLLNALGPRERLSLCATSLDPEVPRLLSERSRGSHARVVPEDILLAYRTPSAWRASVARAKDDAAADQAGPPSAPEGDGVREAVE